MSGAFDAIQEAAGDPAKSRTPCFHLRERLKEATNPDRKRGLQQLIIAIERDGWRPAHEPYPKSFVEDPDPETLKSMDLDC